MSNNYRSPNAEIVGREGMMYNEATMKVTPIPNHPYGIFSNTNTYAVTFNPHINKPPTLKMENKPVRRPNNREHITIGEHEPPVSLTDGQYYLHYGKTKAAPVLPPYLKKPEKLGNIQGLMNQKDNGNVIYGPTHQVTVVNNVY